MIAVAVARTPRQLHLPVISDRPPGMPRTRAECENGPRPCKWVMCSQHLWLVTDRPGIRRFPGDHPPHIVVQHSEESCALDMAARGPQSYAEIARVMGMKPERARQVCNEGERNMRAELRDWHRAEWDDGPCEDGCDICNADDYMAEDAEISEEEA